MIRTPTPNLMPTIITVAVVCSVLSIPTPGSILNTVAAVVPAGVCPLSLAKDFLGGFCLSEGAVLKFYCYYNSQVSRE